MASISTALVVGGGVAGPVTAAALAKAGISATVYEAYPEPTPEAEHGIGGLLALEPNGIVALDVIGAAAGVLAAGTPITRSRMAIGARTVDLAAALPGLPARQAIERADLHRVLRARAVEAGVPFEYERRLVSVTEEGDGVVAHFADGSSARGDVLIGADGVRSTVRTLIDPAAPDAGYTGLLGFGGYASADIEVEPATMTFAFGRRAYYLYWRHGDGRIAWGVNLPSPYVSLSEARRTPPEEWLRTLREVYADDEPGALLAATTPPSSLQVVGALHIMPPVPQWHRGRLVLVGDAVHAPSNSTGQGASLAIESGIELARCLRDLPTPAAAFAAYEGLRRARVEKIAARGARISRTKAPGPLARRIMPLVLPLVFRPPVVARTAAEEQRYAIDWDAPVA
ncbi:MAG: FAD-dependent monooxygenase [Nocardioides sp.]|nr:FAD-dependent monooxygenase [Nocardioides sp.]